MMEPNFDDVPYQAHNILVNELRDSSKELFDLLTMLIENNTFFSEVNNPIKSVEDLIDFLEDHDIYQLEDIFS